MASTTAIRWHAFAAGLAAIALSASCATPRTLPDPLQAGWKGESVCEALEDSEELRVLRCTFPPGVGHERHFHAPHFGYVLKGGTMQITDADGQRTVTIPDDTTFESDGVEWHEVLNVGETTAIFLIIEGRD